MRLPLFLTLIALSTSLLLARPIPGIRHTLADTKTVYALIGKARDIKAAYPAGSYVIYCLGQSPAYIIKTLQMLEEAESISNRCFFIPFSHGWLVKNVFPGMGVRLYIAPDDKPSTPAIQAYRQQLTSLGITPEQVITNFRAGLKTALVEFIASGSSLASFLSVFYSWAQDLGLDLRELNAAIEVLDITVSSVDTTYHTCTIPLTNTTISLSLRPHPIKLNTLPFSINRLDRIIENLVTIKKHERLVQKYPFTLWETVDPKRFLYSYDTLLLLTYISQQLQYSDCTHLLPSRAR